MVHYRNETINKAKMLETLADMVLDMQTDVLRAGAPPDALQMLFAGFRYRLSERLVPLGYTEDQIDEELSSAYGRVAKRDGKDTGYIKEAVANMRKNSIVYGQMIKSPLNGLIAKIAPLLGEMKAEAEAAP